VFFVIFCRGFLLSLVKNYAAALSACVVWPRRFSSDAAKDKLCEHQQYHKQYVQEQIDHVDEQVHAHGSPKLGILSVQRFD